MIEENTTASDPTTSTTEAVAQNPEMGSTSSTTPTQETEPQADTESGTILTPGDAQKTDGEGGEGEGGDTAPTSEFIGAPEGDYELTGLPEGTVIDETALAAVAPVAKELNLSNEGLSKIAGVYAEKVLPQVVESLQDNLQRDVAAQHAAWATEATELVKTDPVFGGRPLSEVQQVAAKTLDKFGGTDFRAFLDNTGLGNHPAMVKFAYLVGSAISEDATFERGSTAPKPKTSAEKFYGPQS